MHLSYLLLIQTRIWLRIFAKESEAIHQWHEREKDSSLKQTFTLSQWLIILLPKDTVCVCNVFILLIFMLVYTLFVHIWIHLFILQIVAKSPIVLLIFRYKVLENNHTVVAIPFLLVSPFFSILCFIEHSSVSVCDYFDYCPFNNRHIFSRNFPWYTHHCKQFLLI